MMLNRGIIAMMIALMTICKPEIISLDEFYSKLEGGNVKGGIWGAKTNYGSHGVFSTEI